MSAIRNRVRRLCASALMVGAWGSCWILAGCGDPDDNTGGLCGPAHGVVVRVIDGDTVDLADGTRVRYLLIDAPELGRGNAPAQCFAIEASLRNQQLVLGQRVRLEYDRRCLDFYGRTLAYVHRGDHMVNRELVAAGYATVTVIPPNDRHAEDFHTVQNHARHERAGLWGVCR